MKHCRTFLLVVLLCSTLSCGRGDRLPSAFIGTWQSDEELTLKSVRASENVTTEDLAIFEDNFFGDRIIVLREFESGGYFIGSETKPNLEPHRIVESGEDFVVFLVPETDYEPEHLSTWRVEGDLIYAEVEKWQFREYFRRVGHE